VKLPAASGHPGLQLRQEFHQSSIGRYGKQLLANIPWRQECADAIGLGFALPANSQEAVMDKFGQVFGAEELEPVSL
jgi:hypothetical protein